MSHAVGINTIKAINMNSGLKKDPFIVRVFLILSSFTVFTVLILFPLALVLTEALSKGFEFYKASFTDSEAAAAIILTLKVSLIVVPLNTIFGIAAAWSLTKFEFPGKTLLSSLLDIPFAVSPVIAGLMFVLYLGNKTIIGGWFDAHGFKIIFDLPGIILATVFVTFPFVARELIPLMQSIGKEEEEAALILGASGWKTFIKVTLPNIKWGLLYGIVLCNARAMGEFGAVSVVSGHIRGMTNTIPLHVEILYSEYHITASFAVSSILLLVALITLIVKSIAEWRYRKKIIA
jgi:sulfate/thiosulfate transport system permease protein